MKDSFSIVRRPVFPFLSVASLAAAGCGVLLALAPLLARAQSAPTLPPGVTLVRVASGLSLPLFVTAPPGDSRRLFIVEKGGAGSASIKILDLATGAVNAQPFLTLTGLSTSGEQGLLGLAFRPDYATSGKFYVDYTTPGGAFGSGVVTIAEFQVSAANPDVADPASQRVLLTVDKPQTNHNGGWIGFSPRPGDGNNLYVAIGDGGSGNDQGTGHLEPGGNAQNLTTLLGKILRINVAATGGPGGTANYAIPADNPFVGNTAARPEIFAYGLRNPFRNGFDRATGDLLIGERRPGRARGSQCPARQQSARRGKLRLAAARGGDRKSRQRRRSGAGRRGGSGARLSPLGRAQHQRWLRVSRRAAAGAPGHLHFRRHARGG